ncbi:MAG: hypothetical protein GY930_16085 [bacterium]|nr:hypothetical protein [bacterium]
MRISSRTLTSLLILGPLAGMAPAQASSGNPFQEEKPKVEQKKEDLSKQAFKSMTPEEAFVEAAKRNKISILVFVRPGQSASDQMIEGSLKNETLLTWLKDNSIAVKQVFGENDEWIKRKGIRSFPAISVRTANRRILDVIHGYKTAEELLVLFDTCIRTARTNSRPEGEAAEDPYSWLAYGSYLFGSAGDPDEIGSALLWCLDHAHDKDPAFLERHLDFLLRKLAQVAKISPNVEQGLHQRRDALHNKVVSGDASNLEAYALSRFGLFLRDMDDAIRAFNQITPDTKHKQTLKSVLMWSNLERMVAYRRYPDLLEHLPDPLPVFKSRLAAIVAIEKGDAVEQKSDLPRPPGAGDQDSKTKEAKVKPEVPLPGIAQTRNAMVQDAAFFYECLAATGRLKDAEALMILVTDFECSGRCYARFIERANRLKTMELANAIAQRGKERVPEDQIWRIDNMVIRGSRGVRR